MSKRTIILALIAILLIGAALFSAFTDGKPKPEAEEVPEEEVPEEVPEEEIPVSMPENFTIHKFEEAKVTPANNGTNEENKT